MSMEKNEYSPRENGRLFSDKVADLFGRGQDSAMEVGIDQEVWDRRALFLDLSTDEHPQLMTAVQELDNQGYAAGITLIVSTQEAGETSHTLLRLDEQTLVSQEVTSAEAEEYLFFLYNEIRMRQAGVEYTEADFSYEARFSEAVRRPVEEVDFRQIEEIMARAFSVEGQTPEEYVKSFKRLHPETIGLPVEVPMTNEAPEFPFWQQNFDGSQPEVTLGERQEVRQLFDSMVDDIFDKASFVQRDLVVPYTELHMNGSVGERPITMRLLEDAGETVFYEMAISWDNFSGVTYYYLEHVDDAEPHIRRLEETAAMQQLDPAERQALINMQRTLGQNDQAIGLRECRALNEYLQPLTR